MNEFNMERTDILTQWENQQKQLKEQLKLKRANFMNLTVRKNIASNEKLNSWQKIYCENFNISAKDLPKHLEQKKKELFDLADNAEYFKVDTENNPDLERQFQGAVAETL